MSGDPTQALAQAAARIRELEQQLQQLQQTLDSSRAQHEADLAKYRDLEVKQAADLAKYNELGAKYGTLQGQITRLQQQLQEQQRSATTQSQMYQDLLKRFESMYGEPVEDEIDITRGPQPYITPDGVNHATLLDARMHLLGQIAQTSIQQTHTLVSGADKIVPLVQRIKGT
jgi:DNA repair exonuclease SbcCD ATPase subunit